MQKIIPEVRTTICDSCGDVLNIYGERRNCKVHFCSIDLDHKAIAAGKGASGSFDLCPDCYNMFYEGLSGEGAFSVPDYQKGNPDKEKK